LDSNEGSINEATTVSNDTTAGSMVSHCELTSSGIYTVPYRHNLSMIFIRTLLFTFLFATAGLSQISRISFVDPSNTIWFSAPAAKWDEAIPVGNGRLGGMVFGGIEEDRIQLNEETYWSGGPYSTVVKGGHKFLPEIQRLVFTERYLDAHNLFGRQLMGYPIEQQKYQSLANLHLFFDHGKEVAGYDRSLDLKTGVSTTFYSVGGVAFKREVFASAPDQTIVVRLTADKPGKITFTANLRGVRNQTHSNYGTDYFRMDPVGQDGLAVTGKSADYLGVEGKIRYEARIKAVPEGGTMKTSGVDLRVENADAATLYFVAATNFVNYKDVSADQHKRVENYLAKLPKTPYEQQRAAAVADHQEYYDRASLSLPWSQNSLLTTNERKERNQTSPDPSLAALTFFASAHTAGKPAGHLERRYEPLVGQQVHHQHQHPNELLGSELG
jgi:alpha-L-fucosidase 2